MENLFKVIQAGIAWLLVIGTIQSHAQQDYFVYAVKGEPYLEVNDSIKPVNKGSILDQYTQITMNRDDEVQFINEQGDLFELYQTGTFKNTDLQQIQPKKNNTSFTRKLFSYVWKEFTYNLASRNNKSGVVYRGDDIILMRYPADSIQIFADQIRFEWLPIETKEKDYYFVLKDKSSGLVTTIGTPATSLALTVDQNLLKLGADYEWAITETRFANLEKIPFYGFRLLDEKEFKSKQLEIQQLTKDLKQLGFSNSEVREICCKDYKFCY